MVQGGLGIAVGGASRMLDQFMRSYKRRTIEARRHIYIVWVTDVLPVQKKKKRRKKGVGVDLLVKVSNR